MLEVINGFLLVYFVFLCTLSSLVPFIVKPIASCFSRPSKEERTYWADLITLREEQKHISMKDEFAAYSKLQRKIIKLENDLKDNSKTRISRGLAIRGSVNLILQIVIGIILIISVIWFRREPIVVMKGDLFPLTNILAYPSGMPNAISTHMWVVISKVSIRSLLTPIVS